MDKNSNTFNTIGYLHDPALNMDRIAVQTNLSLDEGATLRLAGPDLGPETFVASSALDFVLSDAEAMDDPVRALDHVRRCIDALARGEDAPRPSA